MVIQWIDHHKTGRSFVVYPLSAQINIHWENEKHAILQSGVMLLLLCLLLLLFFFYFTIQKTFLIIRFRFNFFVFGLLRFWFCFVFLFGFIGLISGYYGLWRIILSWYICFTLAGLLTCFTVYLWWLLLLFLLWWWWSVFCYFLFLFKSSSSLIISLSLVLVASNDCTFHYLFNSFNPNNKQSMGFYFCSLSFYRSSLFYHQCCSCCYCCCCCCEKNVIVSGGKSSLTLFYWHSIYNEMKLNQFDLNRTKKN